ncbi:MAG: hypothetical protein KDG89_03325 [Geminicoccaceae bacterium]|nr:hypothetical protein [Geminicoccaceae bacterium]
MGEEATEGSGGHASNRLTVALRTAVRRSVGDAAFGPDGRLHDWRRALMPTYTTNGFVLPDGLDHARLRRAEGGSAVALNSFLPWLPRSQLLCLCSLKGFHELRLHARCPAGMRGTPPRLDLIAWRKAEVVAVTAKGTDYLKAPDSKRARSARIEAAAVFAPWLLQLDRLRDEPGVFRHVDLHALVKLAIGVGSTFPQHKATLLYLFWEGDDGATHDVCRRHRQELEALCEAVTESGVRLHFLSFAELWQGWLDEVKDAWLRDAVKALRRRYGLAAAPSNAPPS